MKKLITLAVLGSTSIVFANQYDQNYNNPNQYNQQPAGRGYVNKQAGSYEVNRRNPSNAYGYQNQGTYSSVEINNRDNPGYQTQSSYGTTQSTTNNQNQVSDQELIKNIHEALSPGWFSKGYQGVSFDVSNGNVNLRGTVDTADNKKAVEDKIRDIDGVRNVNSQIRVVGSADAQNPNAPSYNAQYSSQQYDQSQPRQNPNLQYSNTQQSQPRQNPNLQYSTTQQSYSSQTPNRQNPNYGYSQYNQNPSNMNSPYASRHTESTNVQYQTSNNRNTNSQYQNSEQYAQDFASTAQDREINAKIRAKISNGWFSKGNDTLVLRTTNGVVVISGSVDDASEIQDIADKIRNVEGVRSVNNRLTPRNK